MCVYLDIKEEGKKESAFHFVAVDFILVIQHYTDMQHTLSFLLLVGNIVREKKRHFLR